MKIGTRPQTLRVPERPRSAGAAPQIIRPAAKADHTQGRQRPRRATDHEIEPPKTAKGERRRQELIEATGRALSHHGFRDLSIVHIVKEANAPVGLFYRYFRNKTEASVAALDQLVTGFRGSIPAPGSGQSFFDELLSSHRGVLRLFAERQGLIGCYYSYDYGEPAFARFFHDQTVRFDLDTAKSAIAEARSASVAPEDLAALSHALTCMIDNFAFRYSTGRDDTPTLERSAKVDVARLTATLRYRGFLCASPPSSASLPEFLTERQALPARHPRIEFLEPRIAWTTTTHPRRSPKRVDSVRTYTALKVVALALLNRLSYDDLRIADIEQAGQTTRGSIYHYFGEKRGLMLELLRERLELTHDRLMAKVRLREAGTGDSFADLDAIVSTLIAEYAENPGILRAIYQLEDRDTEIAAFLQGYRRCWVGVITDVLTTYTPRAAQARPQLQLIVYALLAMLDRFAYDIYVSPFPELQNEFSDPSQVAAFVTTIWHRCLFLRNPSQTVPQAFPVLAALGPKPSVQAGRTRTRKHRARA